MEHVGIDLGATYSHIAVLDSAGQVLQQRRLVTEQLPQWLSHQPRSQVVMEACTQSPTMARAAIEAGHSTKVIPGQLVRALGVGSRGIKTDERDALVLAQASVRVEDLPSVHLRSDRSRTVRELLSARSNLVAARRSVALSCKSWMRGRLVNVRGRAASKHFSDTFRRVALEHPEGLPMAIEVLLDTFDQLTDQIERLDAQIEQLVEHDPVCQLLMTVPGVGPQVALMFTAQVDDPQRFATAEQLASYLALAPGEATTGGKVVRTGTLKAGPTRLKALLVQAAWVMWRTRPNDPAVLWARALADKRGKHIAVVALARKIATVLWAMWKQGSAYDPARASSVRASHH